MRVSASVMISKSLLMLIQIPLPHLQAPFSSFTSPSHRVPFSIHHKLVRHSLRPYYLAHYSAARRALNKRPDKSLPRPLFPRKLIHLAAPSSFPLTGPPSRHPHPQRLHRRHNIMTTQTTTIHPSHSSHFLLNTFHFVCYPGQERWHQTKKASGL